MAKMRNKFVRKNLPKVGKYTTDKLKRVWNAVYHYDKKRRDSLPIE